MDKISYFSPFYHIRLTITTLFFIITLFVTIQNPQQKTATIVGKTEKNVVFKILSDKKILHLQLFNRKCSKRNHC